MNVAGAPEARAAWLLRWYPRAWRDRYGAEFTELLIADTEERPRSFGRALDVARGGMVARLADSGLAGTGLLAAALPVAVHASRLARRELLLARSAA